MRTLALTTLLLLATAAPLAAAHLQHAPSCTSRTLGNGALAHVDLYNRPCAGAVAYSPAAVCYAGIDSHNVVQGVHVLVLYGGGCQTGVVIEPLTADGAGLLP